MSGAWELALTEWLPEPLAKAIGVHEAGRFRSLVNAVKEVAASIPDEKFVFLNEALVQGSVKWISHVEVYASSSSSLSFTSFHDIAIPSFEKTRGII